MEDKLDLIVDVGTKIQQLNNDLGDTADVLAENKEFLTDFVTHVRAPEIIDGFRQHSQRRVRLDFISLAPQGQKLGFKQVLKEIDRT